MTVETPATALTAAPTTGPTTTPDPAPVRTSADVAPAPAPVDERVFTRGWTASPSVPALGWQLSVDWVSWATSSAVMLAFFVLIVSGRVVTEGPVLLVLSRTHGIHEGDLFALAALGVGSLLPLLRGLHRR